MQNWHELLVLLLSGPAFGALLAAILYHRGKADRFFPPLLLLGYIFIGFLAPLSALLGLLDFVLVATFLFLGAAAFVFLLRRRTFSSWKRPDFQRYLYLPAFIFLFFLIVRLAFVYDLVLPPFSDSAEHFERIASLLSLEYAQPLHLSDFLPFYHWGFHGITAWVAVATFNTSPLVMALVASFFLALLPVSTYFMLLQYFEGRMLPAIFGAALSGLGWVMPAYGAAFGKYSALLSICLMPLFLAILPLVPTHLKLRRWAWLAYTAMALFGLIWLHTRIIFFILLYVVAASLTSLLLAKFSRPAIQLLANAFLVLVLILILFSGTGTSSGLRFDFYRGQNAAITFFALALSFFAVRKYLKEVIHWSLLALLLMAGTRTYLPSSVYHYSLTLFDQLFFDLILFMPLTLLAALGFDGLRDILEPRPSAYRYLSILLLLIISLNGWFTQPWHPLPASNYVTLDDLRVFSWLSSDVPTNAQILVASLKKSENYYRPSDAGAWIPILTGKHVVRIPYQFDWYSPSGLPDLCRQYGSSAPLYVYLGHTISSFNISGCEATPALLPVLCYPQSALFSLSCTPSTSPP